MIESKLLKVLNCLSDKQYITASEIAKRIDVSEKTVRNRIKALNEKMININTKVVSKKGNGYILEIGNSLDFQNFITAIDLDKIPNSNEDRVDYVLFMLLNTNEYVKMDDICDKLYVSRNVLSANLKEVELKLSKNDLTIERRPNYGFKIAGNEFNKRIILIQYFYDRFNVFGEDEELQIVGNLVLRINRFFNVKMTELTLEYFIKYIKMTKQRIQQGFIIKDGVGNNDQISDATLSIVNKIVEEISRKLHIDLDENEKDHLAIFYGASLSSDSYSDFGPNFVITSAVNEMVIKMIDSVHETLSLDFKNNFELRMSLNQHMVPMDIRLKYGIHIENPLLNKIKEEYSFAYTIAVNAVLPLNKLYKNKVSEDEIGFIALIFALTLEKNERKTEKKNIIVVCATGKGSSQLFMFRFKKAFSEYINNIYECTPGDLTEFDFDRYNIDYVFTTIPLNEKIKRPICEISLFFDNTEIIEYSSFFEENDTSFINKYFKEYLFFNKLTMKNKAEAITSLINYANHFLDLPEAFNDAVIKREKLGQTDFGGMVAIPHPYKIITEKTHVVIGILEEPIWWGNNYVQLIFLFTIGSEFDSNLEKFYDLISNFVFDYNRVEKLIENPTFSNLLGLLTETDLPLS